MDFNPDFEKEKSEGLKEEKFNDFGKEKSEGLKKEKLKKNNIKRIFPSYGWLVFLIIAAFLLVLLVRWGRITSPPPAPSKPAYIDLTVSVIFTGTQFVITNGDNFDWTNVKLEVNPGLLKSGFILKTQRMSAGETYTVGAMQFAKGDGTRLNPFAIKPQKLSISCDTPRGEGFWVGGWE